MIFAIVLFDLIDGGVQDRILRLQLIGIQKVVVNRTQIANIMCLPGQGDGIGAGNVNRGRCLNQVVGGLKGRVAFADDQHLLIDKFLGVHGDRRVILCKLDAGDIRNVWFGDASGDNQMTARMGVAVTVPKVKQTILLANPPNFCLVLDVEIVVLGIIAEILDKTIGWWKKFLAILAEQKPLGIRQ